MSEPLTIKSGPPEHPAMDFNLLREKGLEYVRRFAAATWTDHNTHDPGITILEALCYAITDLGYRLSYDMEDLLAPDGLEAAAKPFFTAREILPAGPVTANDYRKLLIDITGVKNAWIEPLSSTQPELFFNNGILSSKSDPAAHQVQLKGLFRILIEKDESTVSDADLKKMAGKVLAARRNLCEDFTSINILPERKIIVRAAIEIEHGGDPDRLLAQVYHDLSLHISPRITFHSLNGMKALGKRNEEIFNGPTLEHGFIDDEELKRHQRKTELHISDMIHVVMQVNGVSGILEIKIAQSEQPNLMQEWVLKLESDVAPALTDIEAFCKGIDLYKDGIPCQFNLDAVNQALALLRADTDVSIQDGDHEDIPLPAGAYRALADYETIQNDFPLAYGIGRMGLADSASVARKAQAKQLQAYLAVFDQILANYFSQLDHARELFAIPETSEKERHDRIIRQTFTQSYFPHPLSDTPGEDEFLDRTGLDTTFAETIDDGPKRRNRFLDHLLARFGERFPDISQLGYASDNDSLGRLVLDKALFLADYPAISRSRGGSFNYGEIEETWNTENVSGLKKRICGLLCIKAFQRKRLAESATEGFHLVEHILLRPQEPPPSSGAQEQDTSWELTCKQADPFSYAVTYVFPGWVGRFAQEHPKNSGKYPFRDFTRETLVAETPAHISLSILWLEPEKMSEFEVIYERWLSALGNMGLQQPVTMGQPKEFRKLLNEYNEANDEMIQFLGIGQRQNFKKE